MKRWIKTASDYAMEVRDYYLNNNASNYKSYSPTIKNLFQTAIDDARKTQHEETWAMALDAAAMVAPAYDHRVVAEHIKSIPCPPLQTTNEQSE